MPLICLAVFVCCSLALRIKGKIVIQWLVIFVRYTSRPRHYICNKNDSYNRNIFSEPRKKTVNKQSFVHKKAKETSQQLAVTDAIQLERVINHPQANLRFKFAKKGGMYISVSQIK